MNSSRRVGLGRPQGRAWLPGGTPGWIPRRERRGGVMAEVLVTGAAGFIGSHLSESLVRLGWNVRGLDAFTDTYDPRLKRANVRGLLHHPRFELITADLTIADLVDVLDGVDVVAHLAGEPGVASSWGSEFPRYLWRNVLATQRLLAAARLRGVTRIAY